MLLVVLLILNPFNLNFYHIEPNERYEVSVVNNYMKYNYGSHIYEVDRGGSGLASMMIVGYTEDLQKKINFLKNTF